MKKTPIQQAAALLAAQSRINPTPAQQAASRENGKKGAEHGKKGGRPREYDVRASVVKRFGADKPVTEVTVVPAIEGWPGASDEVTLQSGQWLEIVRHGSPESWSKAVIRG